MKRLALWLVSMLTGLFCLLPLAQAQSASDYTQGVEVSGTTAKIWFKPTSSLTTWVDVHYQHNGGPQQSLRMTWNTAAARYEQNVLSAVATGHTISYRFTYNKGTPAYDTPTFSHTVGSGGGTVATPTFSPAGGTYSATQNVSISTTTAGASILYTTDGSTPTASSTPYTVPIAVASSRTIKAIAIKSGMTNSAVATAAYTINGGGFSFTQGVDVSGTTATIWFQPSKSIAFVDVHYTVNGGAQQNFRMTLAGSRHQQAVNNVSSGQVIGYWFTYSETGATTVDTGNYNYTVGSGGGTVATPTFSPGAGTYTVTPSVAISTTTAGATIRYTQDGSNPTASSPVYSGPIAVTSSRTLRAIAMKSGMTDSAIASAAYTITGSAIPPTFSPAPGTYTSAQSVVLASMTSGATIRYTTDGSAPTTSSPIYTGPISVTATTTIRAMATKSGMGNSTIASGTYTIQTDPGEWNGMTTFNIVNQTNGRWADSQVYWAIIGKDWATGRFVRVDANGNLVPMQLSDNGALTKNGQGYTNYFVSLAQKRSVTIPAINSARILFSVGGPMYIKTVVDGAGNVAYAGADIQNPSDPNIDVYFDFGEMAILPKGNGQQGIFVNTSRVDQFGFPLKLRVQGLGGYDKTVGEPLTETRDQLFSRFIAETPAPFHGLAQAPHHPYRIIAPSHATFKAGQANENYLQSYIDAVWARYRNEDLVFTLENHGTFRGRVSGDRFVFTGGNLNGTYYINGKPTTSMVFLGNGYLDDRTGAASTAIGDMQLQIQAQVCAALNRHVLETPANWYVQSAHHPAGQVSNWFSKFWHDHSIDRLTYGFAYDDVGGLSPSLHTSAPTTVTFTIGW